MFQMGCMNVSYLRFNVGVWVTIDVHRSQMSAAFDPHAQSATSPLLALILHITFCGRGEILQAEQQAAPLLQTPLLFCLPLRQRTNERLCFNGITVDQTAKIFVMIVLSAVITFLFNHPWMSLIDPLPQLQNKCLCCCVSVSCINKLQRLLMPAISPYEFHKAIMCQRCMLWK